VTVSLVQLPWRTYTLTNSTKIRRRQESGGRGLELMLRGEKCDARMGAIDSSAQLVSPGNENGSINADAEKITTTQMKLFFGEELLATLVVGLATPF
jgi:hypothetical protein